VTLVQAISIGHALDVDGASSGIVQQAFAHAVNLGIGGEMWTLLAADRPDLPFGIRTASHDFGCLDLRPGDRVGVRSGFVGIRSGSTCRVVDCRSAQRWQPAPQDTFAPGVGSRLALVAAAASDRAWHGAAPMAEAVRSALGVPDALRTVLGCVVGHGPGSTPSGDDVLVGIFAVLTASPSGAAGAAAARSLDQMMRPLLPGTTDISMQLLRQASRGLVGRAVHELICAISGETNLQALRIAIQRVVETGVTSGADTCMGLLAFAPSYFLSDDERAAA
jgi:Protein of unknown function (DUF2877)